jgi:hypothetical protein
MEDAPKYAQRIRDLSDGVLTRMADVEQAASALVAPNGPSQAEQKNLPHNNAQRA